MLQETVLRLNGIEKYPPMFICNEAHRFIAAEQIRQLGLKDTDILLEPVGRNTAPAIALAAFRALKQYKDPVLLVLAADHVIYDQKAFHHTVEKAIPLAQQNKLVTFGVVPTSAETGYGYIFRGEAFSDDAFKVAKFVEKPDLDTAMQYLESGEYYWNSGMFMFKASIYLAELKKHRHDIYEICEKAIADQTPDLDFIRINKEVFETCPEDSIDYAVMEKTLDAVVVPFDAGWNDVGGFTALWQLSEQDKDGNVFKGDVVSTKTHNTLVVADYKLVAAVGVDDLVIISTKDALLVAHKDKSQEVKAIVNHLKAGNRKEVMFHREVYRPWGKYDSVDSAECFQVKRITVKPGAKLSVQMHRHRAEHWIVVSGTAKVTNGDKDIVLTENQSTYIPVGVIHSLENPGKMPLELIEVQSGSYLGEDDIVRFEDRYGRS